MNDGITSVDGLRGNRGIYYISPDGCPRSRRQSKPTRSASLAILFATAVPISPDVPVIKIRCFPDIVLGLLIPPARVIIGRQIQ